MDDDARFAELHGIVGDLRRMDELLREGFHIGSDGKRRDGWSIVGGTSIEPSIPRPRRAL